MKIQCDVCDKGEASVFCVADEAALCGACDHRVHHANKLAGKHQRFSLHHPSPKQAPLCDICKERRAFLFCQQDRAILCIECNISIHKANEHTQKHTRFLLTGVKLSSHSALYSSSSQSSAESASSHVSNDVPNIPLLSTPKRTIAQSTGGGAPAPHTSCNKIINPEMINSGDLNDSVSASSISEYLIETLPGWHVEDLLDSSSFGFSKSGESDLMPFWDGDLEGSNMNGLLLPTQRTGMWVPQVHPPLMINQTQNQSLYECSDMVAQPFGMMKEQCKEFSANNNTNNSISKSGNNRKRTDDSSFLVPQIRSSPSSAPKKLRTLW